MDQSASSITNDAEEWESWPTNCRSSMPAPHTTPISFQDALQHDLERPKDTKVFHITEYSKQGTESRDDFVNEEELARYFSDQRTHGNQTKLRLFFACADRSWNAAKTSYMRRWWSHYSVPMGIAMAFSNETSDNVFKVFTEDVTIQDGALPRKIHHLWLGWNSSFFPLHGSELEYCQHLLLRDGCIPTTDSGLKAFFPSIYVQRNTITQETIILALDYPPLYSALQRTCSDVCDTALGAHPFTFSISYLGCVLASTQNYLARWPKEIENHQKDIFDAGVDYSRLLQRLTYDPKACQQAKCMLDSFGDLFRLLARKHSDFQSQQSALEGVSLKSLEERDLICRRNQNRMLGEVASHDLAIKEIIDILLGLTQIRNGESMRKIAEQNQKQAVAAERDNKLMQRIAMDTKRDSEIMRTITVVTLIYLPATFVCTMLSMGLFEWPSQGDGAGHVRIARTGWIFLVITIPLTIITCGIAWMEYTQSSERARAELDAIITPKPEDQNITGTGENKDEVNGQVNDPATQPSTRVENVVIGSPPVAGVDGTTPNHPNTTAKPRQQGDVLSYLHDRLRLLRRRLAQVPEQTSTVANPV